MLVYIYIEVNVEKSGVMHIRRRGIKRTVETFLVLMRGLELWRSISIWGVWQCCGNGSW